MFERASSFEVRGEDAARIAETLVLARRAVGHAPPADRGATARTLSTGRFTLTWLQSASRPTGTVRLERLRAQIVAAAPELIDADLRLHLMSLPGGSDIGGSVRLPDGTALAFSTQAKSAWSLNLGRIVGLVLPTLLLVTVTWLLLRHALGPLKMLIEASRHVGAKQPEPLPERGPEEIRRLIRAMNQMQERIHLSLLDRTQTMLAIGHDLRTPLARMQLRLETGGEAGSAGSAGGFPGDDGRMRADMERDIAEMRHLIESLQSFVESGGEATPQVRMDLAVMAATLVDAAADVGARAAYRGCDTLEIVARPVAVRRLLANLIDNALHHGGNAVVSVRREGARAVLRVEDDGPGIPEDRLADVCQPFVRLDAARARDTSGMGLGLAIVGRSVRQEGGTLAIVNRPEGGLRVEVALPGLPPQRG